MKTESPNTLTEIADRYRRLAARFTDLVEAVPNDRWDSQSPCEDWKAKDVLAHVVNTEADHLERMEIELPESIDGLDPHKAWPIVRDRVQQALDTPTEAEHSYDGFFGRTTLAASIDQFYSMDLVIHAWDLARAAGLKDFEPMLPAEIAKVNTALESFGDNMRQPGVFGPEVPVPAGADAQTKLLAVVGRRA
jgi:uncharacterized protein (TIGR03086 family)